MSCDGVEKFFSVNLIWQAIEFSIIFSEQSASCIILFQIASQLVRRATASRTRMRTFSLFCLAQHVAASTILVLIWWGFAIHFERIINGRDILMPFVLLLSTCTVHFRSNSTNEGDRDTSLKNHVSPHSIQVKHCGALSMFILGSVPSPLTTLTSRICFLVPIRARA